ncbi:MAG: carboxypeptidase regulatory-like domain-containing protein [Acidobacteria bacterium]|nr:MAG: carboxypeptidase regulatory-like domain-containing protein [Acidobacteriota bacterium]REK03965.1 MAG: carboxypeptidase regulatory-like domain-containing protein [Acidobacteriota bacterium]REK15127.1 MAG: carboxypeptidase regulatory-like domain-containing protein [Acidobacteriota bacterium]REK46217.1 MAG: carboxypeptidase regulatory-like domain-containing protein [Acidobacteriota bacterium]
MIHSLARSRLSRAFAAIAVVAAFAFTAFAQSGTSRINGVVTDQTGAAVPGATVTITNPATGYSRKATTDNSGSYNFPGIPPATYRLEVEAGNFKKAVNNNVQALVDSSTSIDIVMETGDVSAVVDVTTNTIESVVNTQDASIGNNFVPEQITQLPTNLRQVNDLLSLQPGVTRDGYVAGGRSDQANITLDGVDINDQQTGGRTTQFQTTQNSALRVTTESVEEFRITTLNANANQGRSSGAQISLVTKSGTNEFHGSAFYFYRPTAFSANDFFNNLSGIERPSLARDVFGGSIGGPIIKDKLFFFYSYEGQRQESGVSTVRVVPLSHLGNGELRFEGTGPSCNNGQCVLNMAELNNIYSQVGLNPTAISVLADAASRYPANDNSVGDGINTGGFRFNSPLTVEQNTNIARFDYNVSDDQLLFARLNYQWDITTGSANTLVNQQFPDTPATGVWSHPTGGVLGHNWTINSNMINNFRLGFTRQAFSQQGDSSENAISFRFVYSPRLTPSVRTLSRVTPVWNITDDFTWIKGNHTLQFGGNVRLINNKRASFNSAYDSAVTNPSFYDQSGAVITNQITNAGYSIDGGSVASVQAAATALIGRYSQYSGNFTFDIDGSVLPAGTPSERNFATEEYDVYFQDIFRPLRNLTITGGIRYALSRPVYEKNGFQVVPTERLGDFFDRRVSSARIGVPTNDSIQFQLGGPANNGPGFYSMDWNNWQPRIAATWTPDIGGPLGRFLFGEEGDSTIRGGFAITNDYFGGQLAVSFDQLSTIGFTSTTTIAANTYNVTDRPAPLFTGFGEDVRALPGIPPPMQRFDTPADEAQRIETSLDSTIISPQHYQWNLSYGRSLPKGAYFEASYIGRSARNLFASRDIMALNNLVDPASGMDWYTAAGMLHDLRAADTPNANIPAIPFFENLFPGAVGLFGAPGNTATQGVYNLISRVDGFDILDWTFVQLLIDDVGIFPNMFFHPQYAAFSAFGTTAYSDYHGGSFSLRQRLGNTLSYDINYTFSKSMDNASGLQTGTSYGSQFILNALRPEDNYAVSDFDTKHLVNANFLFNLPIGRGQTYFSDMNGVADVFFGGWQLAGVYRWNTGQPIATPFDQAQWATNWNAQSNTTRIRDVQFTAIRDTQNVFADPQAAFNSFRNARPGETGERNAFRLPGYQTLDLGLTKNFTMPWNEDHKFQFRWEVFNVTNTQYFQVGTLTRANYGLPQDPETGTASSSFGALYTGVQGSPRAMQFGLRYSF